MAHLELIPKENVSSFRKLAIGSWKTAYDPTVYGTMTLRMDKALAYIEAFRVKTGIRLTVTHLLAKAMAEALRRCPDANAILRFNRIYLRKRVTISTLVVQTDGGKVDLTSAKIDDAEQKSLREIAAELEAAVQKVRQRKDEMLERGKGTIHKMPYAFLNFFTWLISFFMYTLNWDMTWAGMPRDAFGSAIITNVGSLGLDTAYVPLVPYTRVPIFIAPGAIKDAPVVENGKVVPGKLMNVNASFDHRFIDGFHASILANTFREMLENPFEHFDKLDDVAPVIPADVKPPVSAAG
ncbi:pyruvate dehydrogenase E2 component (dihydrolipoamide acetyltransferase) [Archangium gephyra]|uniref:Dihydrolipoamide acyltransferase component of branched-chain alpha-keto acid dehydrogenase complex n=1 Tax=Archangium gephyra TaxID=48 RepID=A0AAC8Q7X8_9BACT|nr:2-oxo acid dehydrogenase subunit E2 [Archangium gephyra]AKJ02181.1 Dihydrolipoamide acyltransferase component of branched-chain alpha-keto acid dehydrogenase complex [Archangium gephyra]REG28886.1 pyruvate dehydrogenase E2 component (dihydrolipoamide acetyltransferase) [Archangium gephyra]